MCGIIACVGSSRTTNKLMTGLANLEYRGYDSAGIAVENGAGLDVRKREGKIEKLENTLVGDAPDGEVGIGHTRWSTHGPPSDANAHPHTTHDDRIAVVHNGIIENHKELKTELRARGYEFTSDTDTEVIPHLVDSHLDGETEPEEAFRTAIDELEGSYAVAAVVGGTDAVFAARQDSPLVLGLGDEEYYLASDVPAFLDFTDEVVYLDDGDVVVVEPNGVTLTDVDGRVFVPDTETVDWDPEETGKGRYDHYMLKEIEEQPEALSNTITGRVSPDEGTVELDALEPGAFAGIDAVQLVACGTSYHAALYGQQLCNRAGITAQAYRANEYTGDVPVSGDTLVVAVTQSGETADTLDALRAAEAAGAESLTVTNVVGSTAAREADRTVYIRAGPEIAVAATKTFSSQATTLALLAERLAEDIEDATPRDDHGAFLGALQRLPDDVEALVSESRATSVARRYRDREAYFFIGHQLGHPVALEGALKCKEITYEHAEGFASGALKHGPLALVTRDTVIIAVFNGRNDEQTRNNAAEAKARGADIIAVAPESTELGDIADARLTIPDSHPDLAGLLANIQLQLAAYRMADLLDRPIDKPRNLAKSVTVK